MGYTALAILAFALQNMACKGYTKANGTGPRGLAWLTMLSMLMICIVLGATGTIRSMPTGAWWLCAAFGLCFVATFLSMNLAMARGPLGHTVLLVNSSMLIPVAAGLLIWHETLTLAKGAGILLVVAVLYLSARPGSSNTWRGSIGWLLLSLGAMLGNGVLALLQRAMAADFPGVTAGTFTLWSSAVSAIACVPVLVAEALTKRHENDVPVRAILPYALGIGLGTAGGNSLTVLALTALPSVVLFPVRQGGLILLMWLLGLLVYGEKPDRRGILTLVLGLAGIVLLSIG